MWKRRARQGPGGRAREGSYGGRPGRAEGTGERTRNSAKGTGDLRRGANTWTINGESASGRGRGKGLEGKVWGRGARSCGYYMGLGAQKRAHYVVTQSAPLGACVRELLGLPPRPRGAAEEARGGHTRRAARGRRQEARECGRPAFDEGVVSRGDKSSKQSLSLSGS